MASLGQALEQLVQACCPSEQDYNRRLQLTQDAERALQRLDIVENLRVIPYGSFVSGFYNSNSDLDLAIVGQIPAYRLKPAALAEIYKGVPEETHVSLHKLDRRTKAQLLRDAGRRLTAAGVASREGMEYILHARVPIIKFRDRRSGLEVDLCLGNEATSFKAWSIAQVASIHPAFGQLFRVVKVWAKAHAINDGASHLFNSWCLTLVVIFFLQTLPSPLLPPLYELLYDNIPDARSPRLLQHSHSDLPSQVYEVMKTRTEVAKNVYGSRPAKPLDELFRDFVEDGSRKLRSLLASQDTFLRDTRMSTFYGQLQTSRPFATSYVMCVEDPYDDTDNTARTLGTWEGHPGTIHYVTSVFERTLRHLNRHINPSGPQTSPVSDPAASTPTTAEGSGPSSANSEASSAAGSGSSLACTLVFLFGTELLTRLPGLSEQVLGRPLFEWAQGALAAGRPFWEVHEALLQQMGAADEFVSFDSFKRRHKIKVHNEAKYATPEEKAAAAARDAACKAAKKVKDKERQAARREKQTAERAAPGQQAEAPVEPREARAALAAATAAMKGRTETGTEAGEVPSRRSARARPVSSAAGESRGPSSAAPSSSTAPSAPARRDSSTGGGAAASSDGAGPGPGSRAPRVADAAKAAIAQALQRPASSTRARTAALLPRSDTDGAGEGRASRPLSRVGSQDGSGAAAAAAATALRGAHGGPVAAAAAAAAAGAAEMGSTLHRQGGVQREGASANSSTGGPVETRRKAGAAPEAAAGQGSGRVGPREQQRPKKAARGAAGAAADGGCTSREAGCSSAEAPQGGGGGAGGSGGATETVVMAALQGLSVTQPRAAQGSSSGEGTSGGPNAQDSGAQGRAPLYASAEGSVGEQGRSGRRGAQSRRREHGNVRLAGGDEGASVTDAVQDPAAAEGASVGEGREPSGPSERRRGRRAGRPRSRNGQGVSGGEGGAGGAGAQGAEQPQPAPRPPRPNTEQKPRSAPRAPLQVPAMR